MATTLAMQAHFETTKQLEVILLLLKYIYIDMCDLLELCDYLFIPEKFANYALMVIMIDFGCDMNLIFYA